MLGEWFRGVRIDKNNSCQIVYLERLGWREREREGIKASSPLHLARTRSKSASLHSVMRACPATEIRMHSCPLSPKGGAMISDLMQSSSSSVLVLTLSFDHSLRSHLSSGGPKDKTLLLFVIRDHIGSTPMENLRATIMADLDRIWDSLSKVS